ncbi:hypothetical protein Cgig2_014199 [Carnegiea gigantea]|uniref:DUF4283 domain-containing protein n=1 Tax=Carnegiea gigantea TaxID=171969 RepID=A0A9Q1JS64_9CARY|nr:hypothetical protein Cgig2_014199 [Carnegiea gigantea]
MGSEIEKAMAEMKLKAVEEMVVEFEEEVDDEKVERIALSPIGKLHTTNSFNVGAMKATFKNGLLIKELDRNLFLFQFFSKADKDSVLNDSPWAFDGHTLLLKELTGFEKYSNVVFDMARFWVKLDNVPGMKQTKAFVECLVNAVGKFVSVDEDNSVGLDKSLNFVADINIDKPLRRGIKVKVQGKPVWFDIQYIKLSDFCYACLKVGHVYKGCELYDENIPKLSLPYMPKLRASPIKTKRRGWEAKKQEEKMRSKKANSKLILDNPEVGKGSRKGNAPTMGDDEVMLMNIDEARNMTPGSEVFKRKSPEEANPMGEDRRSRGLELMEG